ncbi:TonB-dependent receptor [Rubrivirga sp. IMCC45206]|uniref:TonB-dependent receptor n=1 Tax=Rubrivirga sp. IMCC45206 TaxID=3391614 RepID=UPI0039902A2D
MVRLALGCLVLALVASGAGAQVVNGTVTDAETGGALIGAAVYAPAFARGTTTNAYGHFSLPLPADSVRLVVSMVGYDPLHVGTWQARQGRLDVALRPLALGEVVVEAGADRPEDTPQLGQARLTGRDVIALPALLGEADVLKAVQLLPGVRAGQEATAGLYVRGGSPDQTLVLLDGTPLYNAAHLFGFVSTFNADAVERVELTKGAYPARYGGRLASVLDVRLRDGDLQRHRLQGSVGVLSTTLLAEGPVVPGRLSVLVSGRRTHIDLLAQPFIDRANESAEAADRATVDPSVAFHDVHAKVHWRPTARDRVYLSVYRGGDAFSFTAVDPELACADGACERTGIETATGGALDWGSTTGAVRWTHARGRAFAALTLTASDYGFDVAVTSDEGRGGPDPVTAAAVYRSAIRDLGGRLDVDLALDRHTVRFGGSVTQHRFTPGALSLLGEEAADGVPADTTLGGGDTDALEIGGYLSDTWRAGPLTFDFGVHAALYAAGPYRYPTAEPRLSAALRVLRRVSLKASFATAQQPVHLLTTGAGIGLPADLWVPADSVGPERGTQLAAGLAGSSASGRTTWSVEGYWRSMQGLVAYRDGAAFTSPFDDWQELVVTGEGRSRGLEVLVEHRGPRLRAWLAYTLASSTRRFDAIADGAWFPYRYDRRHDVSAVASVRLSARVDAAVTAVYGTGDAVTLPSATYDATYLSSGSIAYWAASVPSSTSEVAYGPRNGHRLPAYSRVDVGLTYFLRRGPRPHAVALHVYNALNRKNPFVTLLDDRTDPATGDTRQQLVGISLFPILPSLSYRFAL